MAFCRRPSARWYDGNDRGFPKSLEKDWKPWLAVGVGDWGNMPPTRGRLPGMAAVMLPFRWGIASKTSGDMGGTWPRYNHG